MTEKIKHIGQDNIPFFKTVTLFGTLLGLILVYAYLLLDMGDKSYLFFASIYMFVIGWAFDPFAWLIIYVLTPGIAIMASIKIAPFLYPGHPRSNYAVYIVRLCASTVLSLVLTMAILMAIYPLTVCQSDLSFCG